jgi:hypothetical protein
VSEMERSAEQEFGARGGHGNITPVEAAEILGRALDFPQDVGRRLSQFCLHPQGPGDPS